MSYPSLLPNPSMNPTLSQLFWKKLLFWKIVDQGPVLRFL